MPGRSTSPACQVRQASRNCLDRTGFAWGVVCQAWVTGEVVIVLGGIRDLLRVQVRVRVGRRDRARIRANIESGVSHRQGRIRVRVTFCKRRCRNRLDDICHYQLWRFEIFPFQRLPYLCHGVEAQGLGAGRRATVRLQAKAAGRSGQSCVLRRGRRWIRRHVTRTSGGFLGAL